MVHHGKRGARAVSFEISPERREEILRLTGEKTLTAAVNKALVEFVQSRQGR